MQLSEGVQDLRAGLMTKALSEEEFMDAVVDAVSQMPEADYFYHLLYSAFYDLERRLCPVSALPEEELQVLLRQMHEQCVADRHYTAPEYLTLFSDLMAQGEEYDIAVRWTLAKLMGVAMQRLAS